MRKEPKNEEVKKTAENRNSRLIYGNWRHARGTWSPEAQAAFKNRPKASSPIKGRDAAMVEAISRFYSESNPIRLVIMAETLIRDIYRINSQPFPIANDLMQNEYYCKLYGDCIASLLEEFGNSSLIYSEKELDKKLLPETQAISQNVFLVNLRVGMPVKDFLLWYKGTKYVPANVISEWTAIPLKKLNTVYSILINFLKKKSDTVEYYKYKYSSTPSIDIPSEGSNLTINNYGQMEVRMK